MSKLLILGAGNYGYVAREVALSLNKYSNIDFLDDKNPEAIGKFNDYNLFAGRYSDAFVAIGNPSVRKELFSKLSNAGFNMVKLLSPESYVSPSAIIKNGCIVEPKAVVNTEALINEGCLICAGAIINHNCCIGEFSQIDCGAVVGANAVVESLTKVCYNEVVYKK
ncbi:MAG: hypothetical protein J6A69_07120 [Clostridia bacterium]|nr:hypothetical protein [Clostridia bacterium]